MKIGIYPGSFDPLTNGHLDIIQRASRLLDRLIVAVLTNPNKTPLLSAEERICLIESSCDHLNNVVSKSFNGLLIDFMKMNKATIIVKGLRAVSDFEYEFQMALMNKKLEPEIETIFMMTDNKYSYLSSSIVKEIFNFGGCVKDLIPLNVEEEMRKNFLKR